MAQNYTRQSSFADGDTITAALFNNEFNQVVNAFAYSASSDSSTGHKHDGTSGQGGNIPQIGDIDFLNKIVVDNTNNRWGFYVQVSSGTVEQLRIQDGAIVPVTNNDIDLGTSSLEFKDLFIDGTAHIDTLDVDVNATVAGTLGVTGATTLSSNLSVGGNLTVTGNATIAGNLTFGDAATDTVAFSADVASNLLPSADNTYDLGASGSEWKDLYIDGTANIDSLVADTADINGGTVDSAIIGGTTPAAITGTAITATGIMTATGTSVFASLDISGDIDVDGTANLDIVDIDGAVNIAAATTIATDNKIQFRDTGIYINSSADGQLDIVADTEIQIAATTVDLNGNLDVSGTTVSAGKITADAGIDIDNINIDGTTIALSSGDLTLDIAGNIILDADGGYVLLKDAGVQYGGFYTSSSDLVMQSYVQDKDIIFYGNDGGSGITALTLDMSDAGAATFNAGATFGGASEIRSTLNATLNITSTAFTVNSDDVYGSLNFVTEDGSVDSDRKNAATIQAINAGGSGSYCDLDFYTSAGTGATDTKSLKIASNGDISFYDDSGNATLFWDASAESLGIGTTSPIAALDVAGTDAVGSLTSLSDTATRAAVFIRGSNHNNGYGLSFGYGNSSTDAQYIQSTRANGSAAFPLLLNPYGGNVGIGTTTLRTGYALDVQGVNDNGVNIQSGNAASDIALSVGSTSTADKFVILAGGNVGIGTSSPASLVSGGSSPILSIGGTDSGLVLAEKAGSLSFITNDTSYTGTYSDGITGEIVSVSESSVGGSYGLAFYTGTTTASNRAERFRIASDGSLSTPTLGTSNVRFGDNAGNSIASGGNYNTVVGDEAGTAITTGDKNVAVGYSALTANTTAINNTAVGTLALSANTTGDLNVAIGVEALGSNVAGDRSVAIGNNALAAQNPSGNVDMYNVAVGLNAGLSVTTGTHNTLIGGLAGDALTEGFGNVALGYSSLSSDTLGKRSVAIGHQTLLNQNFTSVTDAFNTAVGHEAGKAVTTGVQNTLIGGLAGDAITTGNYNVGVGYFSLSTNTTGASNTAIGNYALTANTTASDNTAVGNAALKDNTTGANNVAVGRLTLNANTTGENNTAVGHAALDTNTTGIQNVGIGINALGANTTAHNNVAVGVNSLLSNTTGTSNTALGSFALDANTTASNNTAVGYASLGANTTGTGNVAVGVTSLDANTDGDYNVAVGNGALGSDTRGNFSTGIGHGALNSQNTTNDTDMYNTAVGYLAGTLVTTGTNNTFVGGLAGDATDDATNCVAVGKSALSANCGDSNTAIGAGALALTTAANNTAMGKDAGAAVTTGIQNTIVGVSAGAISTGDSNTAIGIFSSGGAVSTGDNNTGLGYATLYEVTSGSNNTAIGRDAGRAGSPSGSITTGSNIIVLGDDGVANAHIQVDWTVASDARDKTDFTALDLGLEFVKDLQPVTYKWDKRSKYGDKTAEDYDLNAQTPDGTHKEDWLDIGFKAQEVEALEIAAGYNKDNKTNLVSSHTEDGKQMGLQYSKFVPILVKAIQEQQTLIESLTARIAALEE